MTRRTAADTKGDVSRVLGKLEATGQDLTILRLLANDPGTFRPFVMMANSLVYGATLPADVRETVVLWLARRRRNTYEWAEHVPMSKRAGLTEEQIEALRNGDLSRADADQSFGVQAVDELLADRSLSPSTWEDMISRWGVEGAMDLVLTAGWWGGLVPTVLEALGLEVPDSLRSQPLPVFG
ncbi:MAG TPA: carboxymuconolactone decarboxylase family protein [Acidimicrobiales bacterium]|jgi:alkylhydroperoxidase family enzyme